MMNASGLSMAVSSWLPDRYHITTLSPSRMVLPPSCTSWVAMRRICINGVCQRMISDTMEPTRLGFSRSLLNSSGCSFSATTPPVIELRVVSLPPTISSTRLPRYSSGSSTMPAVSGFVASRLIRSMVPGGLFLRSCHSRVKVSRHSVRARVRSSLSPSPPAISGSDVAISDQ